MPPASPSAKVNPAWQRSAARMQRESLPIVHRMFFSLFDGVALALEARGARLRISLLAGARLLRGGGLLAAALASRGHGTRGGAGSGVTSHDLAHDRAPGGSPHARTRRRSRGGRRRLGGL